MSVKEDNFIKITVGVTLNYFLLGIPLLGLAFYVAFGINFILSLPVFYLGVLFLLSIQSFVIDVDNKKIRKYYTIYPFKIGSWESIQQYDQLVLELTYVINKRDNYDDFGIRESGCTEERTKSFDVYFCNSKNEKLTLIEFNEYIHAKNFLNKYAPQLKLIKVDKFEEALRNSRFRRY